LVSIDVSGVTGGTLNIDGGTNACSGDWTVLATAAYDDLIGKSWTIAYNDCLPGYPPITIDLIPEAPSPYALPLTDYTTIDIVMPAGSDPLIAGQYNLFTLTLTPLVGTPDLDYFFPITGTGYDFLDVNYTGSVLGAWVGSPWGPNGPYFSPVRIGNGPDYVFVCTALNTSLNTIPAGSLLGKLYLHTPPVCTLGVSTGASWEISISQTTQQELDASYAIGQTLSPGYPPFELRPAVVPDPAPLESGYTVDGERLTFPPSEPAYSVPACLPPSSAAVLNWGSVYGPGGVFYRTRIYIEDSSYYNDVPYLDLDYSGPEPVSVQPYLDPPFENNGWSILSAPVATYGSVIYATVVGVQLIRVWAGANPAGVLVWSDTPQPPSPPVAIQQTIYIRSILETIGGNLLTGEVNTPGPNPTLPVVSVSPVVGVGGPDYQIFELISDSIGSYGVFTLSSNGDFEYTVDLTNAIVGDLSPYTPPYYTQVSEPFQFRVTDLVGNTSEGVVNVTIQASYTRVAAAFTFDPIPPVPPNQGKKKWWLNEPLISTLANPNYTFFGLNYPWTGPVGDPAPYIAGYTDQPGNWLIGEPPPAGFFD
jgi:VCBS repeat-containing protein